MKCFINFSQLNFFNIYSDNVTLYYFHGDLGLTPSFILSNYFALFGVNASLSGVILFKIKM